MAAAEPQRPPPELDTPCAHRNRRSGNEVPSLRRTRKRRCLQQLSAFQSGAGCGPTLRVSGGGPSAFDMEQHRNPAVHWTRLVRQRQFHAQHLMPIMAIAPNRSPKRMGIPAHKIQNSLAAGPAVPPKDLMNITTDAGLHIRVARKKHISINFAIHLGKESGELSAKANPAKSIIHPGHDNMTAIRFICLKSWTACAIILIVSCLTIDYAGLYILPHGRIYERLQAGSIALGAHVRQCHSEREDCKGLSAPTPSSC